MRINLIQQELSRQVEDAGYGAAVKDGQQNPGQKRPDSRTVRKTADFSAVEQNVKNMKKRLIVSLIFLDTVDVCVHGTYDISVAQHSDAAVYHELSAWK